MGYPKYIPIGLLLAISLVWLPAPRVIGQQLIANGDFEEQALDGMGNPLVDGQGNFRPASWFYADSSPPNPVVTEWISGDDSDGIGTHSAAIYRANADWRSLEYEVTESETLRVSYDFKFVDVTDFDGFRADVRFFEFPGAGAGFAGETVKGYFVGQFYTSGILENGVELIGISGDGMLANNTWYSVRYDVLVESTQGPTPFFGDFRASTYFSPSLFDPSTVLIDKISIVRPLAGDFNGDGLFDCQDVDALVADIAAGLNSSAFDLTGDGDVDQADLTAWLAQAGAVNNASGNPYLSGDANLNGSVDGSDFGIWNANKFTTVAAWCSGDFNASGSVDGSDFGIWNSNKFTSSDAAPVPEPSVMALTVSILLARSISLGNRARKPSWEACGSRTL